MQSGMWYVLKCPEGSETDYTEKYRKLAVPDGDGLQEVICFEYQRMMRYGGRWHLERRKLLPGWIFLAGAKDMEARDMASGRDEADDCRADTAVSLIPCERPFVKALCREDNLIGMSRGVIREGKPVITSGPLKGRECLIRRIDRHKRTAEIEIPLADTSTRVTVGLEIYEKQ